MPYLLIVNVLQILSNIARRSVYYLKSGGATGWTGVDMSSPVVRFFSFVQISGENSRGVGGWVVTIVVFPGLR